MPNGTTETREYDGLSRLTYLENSGPAGTINSFRYTLDPAGNRTRVEEHDGRQVDYEYDDLYRLLAEDITDAVAGDRRIEYTYGPVGNRLTRDDSAEGVTTYTYDGNDRLLNDTLGSDATSYTYDDNGNTLSKGNTVDRVFYEWDSENRLIGADTNGDGINDVEYQYDVDDVRVSRTEGADVTNLLIDKNRPYAQVLEEYTPGGVIKLSYVFGRDLISQDRVGESGKSFYHVDGLGSTRALSDAAGVVTDSCIYDAFGRRIEQVGSTGNVCLFAGEARDGATGLDYLRARWMDTGVGRFVSRDTFAGTLQDPVTLHKYLYANVNPISNIDPSGQQLINDLEAAESIQTSVLGNLYQAIVNLFRPRQITTIVRSTEFLSRNGTVVGQIFGNVIVTTAEPLALEVSRSLLRLGVLHSARFILAYLASFGYSATISDAETGAEIGSTENTEMATPPGEISGTL